MTIASSTQSFTINGRIVARPMKAPAPQKKFCKFCRAVNRRTLAATTCNYLNGLGRKCGAGICERHTLHLGPDMVRCPHHDPDHGVFIEEAA